MFTSRLVGTGVAVASGQAESGPACGSGPERDHGHHGNHQVSSGPWPPRMRPGAQLPGPAVVLASVPTPVPRPGQRGGGEPLNPVPAHSVLRGHASGPVQDLQVRQGLPGAAGRCRQRLCPAPAPRRRKRRDG
eukprot:1873100-Rhodomonas_salina.2